MKALPYVIILALLGVLAHQFEQIQRLKEKPPAPAAAPAPVPGSPLERYQTALGLISSGKDAEAAQMLEAVAKEFQKDPLAKHALASAAALKQVRARKVEASRKKRDDKDLGKILDAQVGEPVVFDPRDADEKPLPLSGCKPLEDDPGAYSGKTLRLTALIQSHEGELSFPDCSMLSISLDKLKPNKQKALLGRFNLKPQRKLTLHGRFKGLTFYAQ